MSRIQELLSKTTLGRRVLHVTNGHAGVAGFEQPTEAEKDRAARLAAVKEQADALWGKLVEFKAEQLASQRASGDVSDLLEKTALGRRVLAAKKG